MTQIRQSCLKLFMLKFIKFMFSGAKWRQHLLLGLVIGGILATLLLKVTLILHTLGGILN